MTKCTNNIISLYKLNEVKKWKKEEYKEIRYDLELLLEGQKINQKNLQLGFIGLATQNNELIELNKELNVLKKERTRRKGC